MHVNIRCNQTIGSRRVGDGSSGQTTGVRSSSGSGSSSSSGTSGSSGERTIGDRRRYLVRQQALDQCGRVRRRRADRARLVHDRRRAGAGLQMRTRARAAVQRTGRLWGNGRLVYHDHVVLLVAAKDLLQQRRRRCRRYVLVLLLQEEFVER